MPRHKGSDSFVLTLEAVITDPVFADKYFRVLDQIYNGCLDVAMKRLHKLQMDPEYQHLVKDRSIKNRNHLIRQKQLEYGYTEYQMHAMVNEMKYHFSDIAGIDECQKQATKAFRAAERVRFHKARSVRHHSRYDDTSVEGKSKNSALNFRNGLLYIGRKHRYEVIIPRNDDYAKEALQTRTLKYVRLSKRTIRGKTRYFVQLILKGKPPQKHLYGPDQVITGLDVGVSTVAEVSSEYVHLHELAPELYDIDAELRRINRAMDRSRRACNPENYKPDGTIKNGALVWNESNRYRILRAERRDMYRKRAVQMKQSHEILANSIIERSTAILCERMNYRALQRRSKKTTVNRRNGRFNRKSRFGRALANHAPSMFENILDRKLRYIGKRLIHTDTAKVCASQINHVTGERIKKDLTVRMFDIDGHPVQRDLYSAFITGHAICSSARTEQPDQIDYVSCEKDFMKYLALQKRELEQLRKTKQLSWYIS